MTGRWLCRLVGHKTGRPQGRGHVRWSVCERCLTIQQRPCLLPDPRAFPLTQIALDGGSGSLSARVLSREEVEARRIAQGRSLLRIAGGTDTGPRSRAEVAAAAVARAARAREEAQP